MSDDKPKNEEVNKNSETLSEKKPKEINFEEKLKETEDKLLRSLAESENWQVKRIEVKPKQSLSLQMHHHRAEHWIVVSGTAEVQVDDEIQILTEDQSVYIPIGSKHRLTNLGKLPLTLIEVQSGGYLGEDDIVRFEDVYGRG